MDETLVKRLIASQFPEWKDLEIYKVEQSGWDNHTFHLGKDMSIRMPRSASYASQVDKEQKWLPKLAPLLPLQIPIPIGIGKPEFGYPSAFSIFKWIDGENRLPKNLDMLAKDLANFLRIFQSIETQDGPLSGKQNFYRGGSLSVYNEETRAAIKTLEKTIDLEKALKIWEKAQSSKWSKPPVWVHGDISVGNLLFAERKLCAVIDFGCLCIGDPACDLSIAWTLFQGKSRDIFIELMALDAATWERAKGWTLWKALITEAGMTSPGNFESKRCKLIIIELLS